MQVGWVERHGRGWRGGWRENGKKHYTPSVSKKGYARALLDDQRRRIEQGTRYCPTSLFAELIRRFQVQHDASARTRERMAGSLNNLLSCGGMSAAADLTPEVINRWLLDSNLKPATRQSYFGHFTRCTRPAKTTGSSTKTPPAAPRPPNGQQLRWPPAIRVMREEVERVAAEAPAAGTPSSLSLLTQARDQANFVASNTTTSKSERCTLPGTKTRHARRIVTLTPRGLAAYQSVPRAIHTSLVFHTNGRPIDQRNWRARVWEPALELSGLQHRGPYQLRHTFAYFSLPAGAAALRPLDRDGPRIIRLTHERPMDTGPTKWENAPPTLGKPGQGAS